MIVHPLNEGVELTFNGSRIKLSSSQTVSIATFITNNHTNNRDFYVVVAEDRNMYIMNNNPTCTASDNWQYDKQCNDIIRPDLKSIGPMPENVEFSTADEWRQCKCRITAPMLVQIIRALTHELSAEQAK